MEYSAVFLLGCWFGCMIGIALAGLTATSRDREQTPQSARSFPEASPLIAGEGSLAMAFDEA